MKLVVLSGIRGGVGATTLTAELAHQLQAQHQSTVLFDFSNQNALRLHFGLNWNNRHGLAPQILAGKPWHEAAFQCENGVVFLPFGHCDFADLPRFYERIERTPDWLKTQLAEIEFSDNSVVLIDCPSSSNFYQSALALADLIIAVVDTDPLSYAALAEAQIDQTAKHAEKTVFVINKYDPSREIDHDVYQLIQQDLGHFLCPVMIHRDESVREAFVCQLNVAKYEPASQAAVDLATLATWLIATLKSRQLHSE